MMRKFLTGWCLILMLFACNDTTAAAVPKETASRKASDLVNSIGVNTHFGYDWSNYNLWEERLRPRLLELGVKHIRDGTYSVEVLEKYKDVGDHGIRLLLITRAADAVEKAKSIGPMLWGVEAVNEPDIPQWNPHPSMTWVESAKYEQENLYKNIKGDPATEHLPVVGLSLANIRDNPAVLGDLSELMDYGNIHTYNAGEHPSVHWGWGLTMEEALSRAQLVSKDKLIMATESGYHNKVGNAGHPGASETAAAIYHLHLPFVHFNRGLARHYKYEFLDLNPDPDMQDIECHFGLVRTDGTAKPSFYALKNLLALLKDSEADFVPQPLALDVSAVAPGKTIQRTLLQKTDGSWWLALFETVNVFNLQTLQDIEVPPTAVKVTLGEKAKTVNVYVPNKSTEVQKTISGQKEFTLDIGPELTLLEIRMK